MPEINSLQESQTDAMSRTSIPNPRYAPKPESKPAYKPSIPNFADNEETVKKTLEWVKGYLADFKVQGAWTKAETNDDAADEMYRAALTRTQVETDASANKEDTRSNVSSTSYYRILRVITAGETAVMLGNEDDLPVVYEPDPDTDDYREDEGRRIAEDQNMLLAYTFNAAKIRDKIRRILLFGNKYGNQLIEARWDYRRQKRRERVPTGFTDDGEGNRRPKGFTVKELDRVIADWPDLIRHDMKDSWFDAMIDDIQNQSCVIVRKYKQLGELWQLQRVDEFKNVGDITTAHLYNGEQHNSTMTERQTNAGEEPDTTRQTTLFDLYDAWIRLPVNPETGKWEPDKQIPKWYNVVFVGDLDGKPVCAKLSPNTHFCEQIPFLLYHSHDDDKGALHMGYAILLKCLYMMETTVFNQTFDNNTLRTQKPLIADRGSLSVRDKTFTAGGNRVWWKRPGAADPHEMDIQDTTQQSIPLLATIQENTKETAGANKPFLGEAMGSRTSASEAIGVLEQAIKPALEDTKYKANQLLPFVAFWVKEMWREFGDPRRRLMVTYQNEQREIKPAELWGPLNTRVVSIKRFQDNILRRREEDQMLNIIVPLMLSSRATGQQGVKVFFRQVLKNRSYDDVDKILESGSKFDAHHIADGENDAILFGGVYDLPKEGEDHEAHIERHKPFLASYLLLPEEEQNPASARMMKQHIQMHETFIERAEAGAANAAMTGQMPAEAGAPRSPGEAAGDMMGAEAGAMENLPETGRPPIAVA